MIIFAVQMSTDKAWTMPQSSVPQQQRIVQSVMACAKKKKLKICVEM